MRCTDSLRTCRACYRQQQQPQVSTRGTHAATAGVISCDEDQGSPLCMVTGPLCRTKDHCIYILICSCEGIKLKHCSC
jgi:hypothetical protein